MKTYQSKLNMKLPAKKVETENLSENVLKEALQMRNSLYRLNAKTAIGYAFNPDLNDEEISTGEYVYASEKSRIHKEYTGFDDWKENKIIDLESGEERSVEVLENFFMDQIR